MTKRSTIYIRKSNAIKTSAIGLTALLCSACGAESTDNEAEHPPPSMLIITHDDDTGTSYKSPVQSLKDDIKTQEEDDKAVAKKYRKEADRRSEQKAEIISIKKDAEKDVKQAHDKARKQAEEYERKIERLKSERDELKRHQSSVKPSKETKDVSGIAPSFYVFLTVALAPKLLAQIISFVKFGTWGLLLAELVNFIPAVIMMFLVFHYNKKNKVNANESGNLGENKPA